MAKHNVICLRCGKQFDANNGARYFQATERYMCKKCYKKELHTKNKATKEAAADNREKETGMRQSYAVMIVKIAVGLLFVVSSFGMKKISEIVIGFIIGAALIAWGLVPYLESKKKKKQRDNEILAMNNNQVETIKICSSCGATTKGEICEFCGSSLNKIS